MLAIGGGHTNIVQLLLEHGADASLQNKVSSLHVCLSTSAWH